MFSFSNSAPTGAQSMLTPALLAPALDKMFPLTKGVQIVRTSMMGQVWSVSCWTTGFGFSCWVLVSLLDECLKYYRDCLRFPRLWCHARLVFDHLCSLASELLLQGPCRGASASGAASGEEPASPAGICRPFLGGDQLQSSNKSRWIGSEDIKRNKK